MSWATSRSRGSVAVALAGMLLLVAWARPVRAADEPVATNALKYHALLVTRPEPGYLFDRFYNTWLDESTVDALEAYLTKQAAQTHDTADQLLLAFFYVKKGDDVAALDKFNEALAADPASAATWYHKALVEARTLDFDAAIADLKKAHGQSPDDKLAVRIDKQLGKLLVRNGQTAEALQVWQALLKAHPADDELWEDLIELHIDEGLFKEAAALTETLIGRTKDPYQTVMLRLRLGDIRYRAGGRDEAIAVYTSALDDVGAGTWLEREVLAQIDQILRYEDDVAGLKRLYDDLRKRYPKRITIHRRHAQLLLELGENDAALDAYREVLRLTPGDRANREQYVTMLAKVGKQDEAIKELQALCTQYAEDAELRFRLAGLLEEAKRADEAVAAVDEYLKTSDGSEYAYLRGARLLERSENKDATARLYAEMARRFADSASAQEAYAAFLYTQGQKDKAIDLWRALADKADIGQLLHVARAMSARGEHQAAFDLLREHESQFDREPLFLGQLVTTAFALKEYDKAIGWALARVELAEAAAELETAIDQAATTIERANKLAEVARQLESRAPRSVPETCLLAELYERIGNSPEADRVLKEPADAGNLLAVSEQVRISSQRRDWTAAAAAARHILELPGGRKSLYVRRLVELYERDYQVEEALKWVDQWKLLSPGSTTPWTIEAKLLKELGRSDDALRVLRTAVLRFEGDEDLRVRLAQFYADADKLADAERIYWQLYEQTEDMSGKLRWAQELAKLAQQQGTTQQLVENFNQRVENNRHSIVPLLALSEVYRQEDDYEGRRRALTAAAKIKPDDRYLLLQIARVEEQDGDWQAAIATLERAAPLDKTNRTREQIARLHLQYGDEETGFSMLMDLAAPDDADPRTLESVADALCAMQQWDRAAELLQKRIAGHPGDYRLRYLLAVALEESDQTDAAIEQFFQLVDGQEELPTHKQAPRTGLPSASSYFDMMRKMMPAQTAELVQLSQYRYTAYAHRQQRGGVTFRMTVGGPVARSAVQLPGNVDMVRPLALAHLVMIVDTLDDDQRQDVCRVLESHGIEHAEAWSRMDPMRGNTGGALAEILDEDPDNETALAMTVLQGINMRDATLAAHCARAVEVFRESRPQLALLAAIQAGVQEPDESVDGEAADGEASASDNKYLDEALQIAGTLDSPNPIVVMGITSALGGMPGRSSRPTIGEPYREKFSRLVVDWYPKLNGSPWGNYAFYMVMMSLSRNDDPTAYVKFLDDEVSRSRVGGGVNRRQTSMPFNRGNRAGMLAPLEFPPPLADFPAHVLAVFSRDANSNPYGVAIAAPGDEEDAAEKIKPALDRVKSPILRILLAQRAGLDEQVDAAIGKLLAAKSPSLNAYLLAASRASERDDHAQVVRLLQKARYLPMNRDMRRQVDAAIVASVLALKDAAKDADDELVDAGRQASLRLRRARLAPEQRAELVDAMESLGLAKEAKKLDQLAAASSSSPARSAVAYMGASPATSSMDRLRKLIDQGKRDTAARLLAGEVTGRTRQALANPQSPRAYSYQFRELRRRVESLRMVDDVLKSLDPGDSRNFRRISEYAMACHLFGKDAEARKQYERVVELRPRDDMSRMQLILAIGSSEPAAAAEHLRKLTRTSRETFGQMLAEQLQDFESPIDQRVDIAALAVQLVGLLKDGDVVQPYWAQNLVTSFGRAMHTNRGVGLPSLYTDPSQNASRNGRSGAGPEVARRREKLHTELCTAMLGRPELARFGFRSLLAAAESKGEATDELAARAEKILLDEATARPGRASQYQQQVRYYSSSSQEVRFRSPEEFLARRAWQSGDWSLVDETLLPKLAGSGARQSRGRLEQLASLYRCDEAEFLDRTEDALRSFRTAQTGQENEGLAIAVDVWADRGLDVDLQPLVLRQLKLDVSRPNHYQPPGYLLRLFQGAAEKWDRRRQLALLDEVATIYIAPADKRNDFLRKNYQANNVNWGTPSGRIYVFGQLVQRLCQQDELVFPVLEHLEPYDPVPVQNLEYRVRNALDTVVGHGADATMKMLAGSPWLEDLDRFRPLEVKDSREKSPLAGLLQRIDRNGKVRDAVRKWLDERQAAEATFGGGLILAYFDRAKNKHSVVDLLGERLDDIKALPDDRQIGLAALLDEMVPADVHRDKTLSPSAAAACQWLIDCRAGQSRSLLARVNKAKRLEELGIQYGQVDDFLRQNMSDLARADAPSAVKVFQRLCELSRDAQRRGQWYMGFSSGQSTDGWLLWNAVDSMDHTDWSSYKFIVDVLTSDSDRPVEAGRSATRAIGQAVVTALGRVPKLPNGRSRPIEDRIPAMYEELGPALDGRPSSLLIPGFCERVRGQPNLAALEKIRAWARQEAEGGKYPELAADLGAAAGLLAEEKRHGRLLKDGRRHEVADYHEHFRRLLGDDELPLAWRVYLGDFLAQRQAASLPLPLACDIVKDYTSAIAGNVPILNDQHDALTVVVRSLKDEPTAKELVAKWRDAWADRYLRPGRPRSGNRRQYERLYDVSDADALSRALEMYLAADESDRVERLLERYNDSIATYPQVAAILIRAGRSAETASFVRHNWPRLRFRWPNTPANHYDASVAAQLPAVCEHLPRDDERYFARLFFASMPDVGKKQADGEEAAAADRDQRLVDLAGELKDVEFTDAALKSRSLVLLSGSEPVREMVAETLAGQYRPESVVVAFHSNDEARVRQETELAVCHLGNRLRQGDVGPLVDLVGRLSAQAGDDDYQFGQRVMPLVICCRDALRAQGPRLSGDQCEKVAAALRGLLVGRQYVYFNELRDLNCLLTALQAQAGQRDVVNKWFESISDYSRREIEQRGVTEDIWKFGLRLNGPATAENLDDRLRYVQNALRLAIDRKWTRWHNGQPYRLLGDNRDQYFQRIVDAGLLTADELKQHGAELVAGVDDNDFGAAAWVAWLQTQQEYEQAAQAWRPVVDAAVKAIEAEPKSELMRQRVSCIAALGTCLVELGRLDEAGDAATMLDGKGIPQWTEIQRLRRTVAARQADAEKQKAAAGAGDEAAPADKPAADAQPAKPATGENSQTAQPAAAEPSGQK